MSDVKVRLMLILAGFTSQQVSLERADSHFTNSSVSACVFVCEEKEMQGQKKTVKEKVRERLYAHVFLAIGTFRGACSQLKQT